MTTMRAVLCEAWGGPDDLVVGEVPAPEPAADEVRIAVKAAGVNFADTLMIAGKYQEKPELPFSPGMEAAGVVEACGSKVETLTPGDRVFAATAQGAFAESVTCQASRAFRIPDAMDFETAAAFGIAYGTSHLGLDHRARLQPGETLLVTGAAGGVGLTAVEIGKVMGATVIAAARGRDRLALTGARGADHTIDYGEEDLRARVREFTDGRGADVVYDPVGGDVFETALRCTAWEGRVLVVGFAAGRIPQVAANYLLVKNIAVVGVFWGAYLRHDPAVVHASFETLFGWYGEGRLRPHISHRFPLENAAEALNTLTTRKATGKVVVTMP